MWFSTWHICHPSFATQGVWYNNFWVKYNFMTPNINPHARFQLQATDLFCLYFFSHPTRYNYKPNPVVDFSHFGYTMIVSYQTVYPSSMEKIFNSSLRPVETLIIGKLLPGWWCLKLCHLKLCLTFCIPFNLTFILNNRIFLL